MKKFANILFIFLVVFTIVISFWQPLAIAVGIVSFIVGALLALIVLDISGRIVDDKFGGV